MCRYWLTCGGLRSPSSLPWLLDVKIELTLAFWLDFGLLDALGPLLPDFRCILEPSKAFAGLPSEAFEGLWRPLKAFGGLRRPLQAFEGLRRPSK